MNKRRCTKTKQEPSYLPTLASLHSTPHILVKSTLAVSHVRAGSQWFDFVHVMCKLKVGKRRLFLDISCMKPCVHAESFVEPGQPVLFFVSSVSRGHTLNTILRYNTKLNLSPYSAPGRKWRTISHRTLHVVHPPQLPKMKPRK